MKAQRYYLVATHGHHTISLIEEEIFEGERIMKLTVDQLHEANLTFPSWYFPGLALGSDKLLIWCGTRVDMYDYEVGSISSFDASDEVIAAYEAEGLWCLVCETSIALLDSNLEKQISRFQHSEVILRSWWANGALIVEDFENRRLEVTLGPSTLEVREV